MLVRMLASGCVEDIFPNVARQMILNGVAVEYKPVSPVQLMLLAEDKANVPAIETAALNPQSEKAVLTYARGPRSLFSRRG